MKVNRHIPVLLAEVIEQLQPRSGQTIVDATLGNAGHSEVIMRAIAPNGVLFGLEADTLALKESREILQEVQKETTVTTHLVQTNFENLSLVLAEQQIEEIDGALFDLGLRSGHLEDSGRGFSFQKLAEPLDMRFDPNDSEITAAVIVNEWSAETIADILYGFGGERHSRRIAARIVKARQVAPIKTVGQLVEIVEPALPKGARSPGRSAATKTFQALRMAVNRELEVLERGLSAAWQHLRASGRLVVISFHSLEDKMVKRHFRAWAKEGSGQLVIKKPIVPTREEIKRNPKSRSAKMRVIEKII